MQGRLTNGQVEMFSVPHEKFSTVSPQLSKANEPNAAKISNSTFYRTLNPCGQAALSGKFGGPYGGAQSHHHASPSCVSGKDGKPAIASDGADALVASAE